MITKYKPKNVPDEFLKFGTYFFSGKDCTTTYFIEVLDGVADGNAMVKIHSTDILSNHFEMDGLKIGDTIGVFDTSLEWLCEVNLWGKYFFPTFNNEMQLYYDDEKYYGSKHKTNSITSLFECINYAIELGLKTKGIKPY